MADMCGICGAVIGRGSSGISADDVRRMTATLAHRGPDDSGVIDGGEVVLGHARLSIIDLSGGAQPMGTEDGREWIVFNGEVYNYVELRDELRALGHRFRTESDTEVILRSYLQWGTSCVSRFNGQFAFAIWDSRTHKLILCRDPVGIRPLYYALHEGALLFASEIKALFACPRVTRRLDPRGIAQTYTFWAPVAPQTVFEGIRQVPPGAFLTAPTDRGSLTEAALRTVRHYEERFGEDEGVRQGSLEENIERFRELFTEAVRLRFNRSDVPVGAYLSGGIDSSVTTALIAGVTPSPLETFSLAFEDEEFDESPYQELVSDALGTRHHSIRVSYRDIGAVFPEVIRHAEQPVLRTAPAPLYLLSGLVQDAGYKVVVTGEGSDEMLAGYDLFRETMVRRFVARDPASKRRTDILLALYPWMKRTPARAPAFAKAFFAQSADLADPALSHRPRWRTSAMLLRMLDPAFGAPAVGTEDAELVRTLPPEFTSWHPLEQAQYIEHLTLLSGYILAPQGDRMLSAHSVEGRFPFLDPTVIRFAGSLPARHKLMGLDEKHILKRAFGHLVPAEILARPKQPYRAPDAPAFFGDGGRSPEWFDELTSEAALAEAGLFIPRAVRGLVEKARSAGGIGMSNTDNMRLVAVVSTMLLHNEFVRNGGPSSEVDAANIPTEPVTQKAAPGR